MIFSDAEESKLWREMEGANSKDSKVLTADFVMRGEKGFRQRAVAERLLKGRCGGETASGKSEGVKKESREFCKRLTI